MGITTNLLSEYKFEGNVNDSFGSNNGTPFSMTYPYGQNSLCANFAGTTSNYVNITGLTYSSIFSGNFSVSFWVNPTSLTNANFLGWGDANFTPYNSFLIYNNSGNLSILYYNGINNIVSSSQPLTANKWQHIVVTVNTNGTIGFYLDKVFSTSSGTSPVIKSRADIYNRAWLGHYYVQTVNQYYNGRMDNLRYYTSILTQTDVDELYNFDSKKNGFIDFFMS